MAEPYYATIVGLRALLGVDNVALPDPRALELLEDAEDVIDDLLGARPVDDTTGRKVVVGEVEGWQAAKLARATLKVAARLYREPGLVSQQRWDREKGPDFEVQGRLGNMFGDDVGRVLDASGLRVLSTRFDGRSRRPPWWSFVYNVDEG